MISHWSVLWPRGDSVGTFAFDRKTFIRISDVVHKRRPKSRSNHFKAKALASTIWGQFNAKARNLETTSPLRLEYTYRISKELESGSFSTQDTCGNWATVHTDAHGKLQNTIEQEKKQDRMSRCLKRDWTKSERHRVNLHRQCRDLV